MTTSPFTKQEQLEHVCDCDTKSALVCKENPDCRPSYCKMRRFDPPVFVKEIPLSSNEKTIRELQEWLDARRDSNVSQIFHDLVAWVSEKLPDDTPKPSNGMGLLEELRFTADAYARNYSDHKHTPALLRTAAATINRLQIEVRELIGAAAAHSDRAEEHRLANERLRGELDAANQHVKILQAQRDSAPETKPDLESCPTCGSSRNARLTIEQLREDLLRAKFAPIGDNHHNAKACPYCSPPSAQETERDDPNASFRWVCPKCKTVNANEDMHCVGCSDPQPVNGRTDP